MDYYNKFCYFIVGLTKNEPRKTEVRSQLIDSPFYPKLPPWLICYPFLLTLPRITLDIIKGVCLKRPKDFNNIKNFYMHNRILRTENQGHNGQDERTD